MQANKLFFRLSAIVALSAVFLQACNRGQLPTSPLRAENLPQTSFEIRADRDTVLRTPAGASLRIPAGSLQPQSGTTARLLIREAYTMGQMLRGGLATLSGSDILSSGGMISVEPGAGTKRDLAKAITVRIPTTRRHSDMQLWSGTADSFGKVDWQHPQPLHHDSAAAMSTGKALFNSNCASCHNMDRDATGPALGQSVRTHDWEYLRAFTRNPSKMIADGDILANSIFCKWKPTVMTAFPALSDPELNAIFTYIDVSSKPAGAAYPDIQASADSCRRYLDARGVDLQQRPSFSNATGSDLPVPDTGSGPDRGMVLASGSETSAYEFELPAFGWYNIDALIKERPGFENGNVRATFSGARIDGISVYLLMPEDNILLEGGPATSGSGSYAFYRNDGTTPLRPGTQGIIAGVKDSAGTWFFAMKPFTFTASQNIELELRPVTKDSLNAMLEQILVRPERKVPATAGIESLKPRNIECGCQ